MASAPSSFIDIAVMEEVRGRFAAGDALAILTVDLDAVLWANGAGAALFGYPDIEAVMGASPGLALAARRQISAAPGFPRIGRDRAVAVRVASGLTSRLVTFLASGVTLPDGEPAILLAVPAAAGATAADEAAARAIAGFGEAGYFAALLDDAAAITAASPGFADLGITRDTLADLVGRIAHESDRLIKRLIPAGEALIPAGAARLTDDPAVTLLIVIDEPVGQVAAPAAAAAPQVGETASDVQPETSGAGGELPAPSDADIPDLVDEAARRPAAPSRSATPPSRDADDWYFAGDAGTKAPATALADADPVRFVWRTDAQNAFSSISEEFVRAVGPEAADVIGRPFGDIAAALDLDPQGEISGLLERRDTWSGRSVMWPVAGTDLAVPVDLAALPVYNRDHVFEGFRGFGVVRTGNVAVDPAARGLRLTETPEAPEAEEPGSPASEAPVIPIAEPMPPAVSDKIIRLAEHRPQQGQERRLTPGERSAFEEIRARLQQDFGAGKVSEEPAAAPERDDGAALPPRDDDRKAAEGDATVGSETAIAAPVTDAETVAGGEDAVDPISAGGDEDAAGDLPGTADAAATGDMPPAGNAENVSGEFASQPALDDTAETGAEEHPAPPILASGFIPSAFSGDGARSSVDPELVASLPVPMLIHAGDELYFANREFLALTGYASLDQIRREGGLDRLFVDKEPQRGTGPEGSKLTLRTLGGDEFPVDAHLQSIRWLGGSALLLALRRVEPPAAPPPPPPASADADPYVAIMRTIIDTATDGVVLIEPDGTIRNISRPAEALFGFDSAAVEGKPFVSLFAIESRKAAQDYLAGLAGNGVASVLNDGREVIGREAKGRFIPLFMTIGKLPEHSGYCAVMRDITHWKRAEEDLTQARAQAERASSQKTEFLARVSHEIRTPLNAIIGFSELMMDEKFGPIGSDRYRDYLRDINRSGNHVLDLVNDLLDISKIEAGEQEMNYEAVSLNDTLAETVAMMQPQANRERVIIRSSLASRLPEVVADLRSVRQIALNLLSNAIRYTQAGGQVIVSTAYDSSGDVTMRVRDTGIGMTLSEIDQALKPFKQINALKRGRHDGTGLGLPLTKAMVEANRARFVISSTPGEGTMVEVVFPSTRVLAD